MANQVEFYAYQARWSDKDHAYIAHCVEIPSLMAHGPTPEAAIKELRPVVADAVKMLIEHNDPVPEPLSKFSGKLLVRIPPDLHRDLFLEAQMAGVSVNRLVSKKLAG